MMRLELHSLHVIEKRNKMKKIELKKINKNTIYMKEIDISQDRCNHSYIYIYNICTLQSNFFLYPTSEVNAWCYGSNIF